MSFHEYEIPMLLHIKIPRHHKGAGEEPQTFSLDTEDFFILNYVLLFQNDELITLNEMLVLQKLYLINQTLSV